MDTTTLEETQTTPTPNGNFSVYSNPTVTTEDESDEQGLSLAECKADTMNQVQEKTDRVFALHAMIVNSGKFCIGKAVEIGNELRAIKGLLDTGLFTKWCKANLGDKLSPTRYRQYIRLSESVEKSPNILVNCETITEALEVCGILRDKREKGSTDKPKDGAPTDGLPVNISEPKEPKTESPTARVDKVKQLVQEIKATINGEKTEFSRATLKILLKPLVDFYNQPTDTDSPYFVP